MEQYISILPALAYLLIELWPRPLSRDQTPFLDHPRLINMERLRKAKRTGGGRD
jgi:hypothetical protein